MNSSSALCRRSSAKAFPSLRRDVARCRSGCVLRNSFPTALFNFITKCGKRETKASQTPDGRFHLGAVIFKQTHSEGPAESRTATSAHSANNLNRAVGVGGNRLGNAAEQNSLQAVPTVGTSDDQIRAPRFSVVQNCRSRLALQTLPDFSRPRSAGRPSQRRISTTLIAQNRLPAGQGPAMAAWTTWELWEGSIVRRTFITFPLFVNL